MVQMDGNSFEARVVPTNYQSQAPFSKSAGFELLVSSVLLFPKDAMFGTLLEVKLNWVRD